MSVAAKGQERREIKPQPGFQTKVAACSADIAIIGGGAGGGKTCGLLFEAIRHNQDPRFGAVYFRRTMQSIRAEGGLWDESANWCPQFGGAPAESILKWRFPSGATISFRGIEYDKDLASWQGTQIPLIIFDELTEFTKKMFFFMISRNRGICSIRPYIRASCNPDPDSWVAEFLSWWIDQNTGFPIRERDGVIRYMMNYKNEIVWGDSKQEVIDKCPDAFKDERFLQSGINKDELIKSVTFIHGDVYENKILLANDPGYLGSLNSMDEADQARFLSGNWKVRADGLGLYDNAAIEGLFNANLENEREQLVGYDVADGRPIYRVDINANLRYITCDAAKFGRDLCVICVWKGWTIVHTSIFHLSAPLDIHNEIKRCMMDFNVPRYNVIVDQDGIGGDVVKLGRYNGFMAREATRQDPDSKVKENYVMFKDQCYFRNSYKVNAGTIKWIVLNSTVRVFDKGAKNGRMSTEILWNGVMVDIKILIKKQLRAIKKGMSVFEGGETKLAINDKDEQKKILNGESPDFADTMMMREAFELVPRRKGKFKHH